MTRFEQLLQRMVDSEAAAERIHRDEILSALNESFPIERRAHLSSAEESVEPPPVVIPGIDWQNGAYRPVNLDQVQKMVLIARQKGRRIRVGGARHSTRGAVYSPSPRDLRVVLAGELQKVEFVSRDSRSATVWVGGGCYLGINPSDPLSTRSTSLNYKLDDAGYALPVLGGISHQTVAGFLQTNSAGGSLEYGFADALEEIELVDGTGTQHVLTKGDVGFDAAGVSMGLFGVVTRVKLKAIHRYFVKGSEINYEQRDSLLEPDNSGRYPLADALTADDYLHINWFPQPKVKRVTQWRGMKVDPVTPANPYDSELKSTWMNVLAAAVLFLTSVLQLAPESKTVQRIIGHLLKKFVGLDRHEIFEDRWLTTLPCDDQAKVDTLIKVIFTEIWLPLDQLASAIRQLEMLLVNPAAAGNFAVEFYGAKESPFWLSPSFGRNVVRVDVFWWAYSIGDPREHFTRFWNVLLGLNGARLHWGKHLPDVGGKYGDVVFNADFLRQQYPRFDQWLQRRRTMDPEGIFVTPYWQRVFSL